MTKPSILDRFQAAFGALGWGKLHGALLAFRWPNGRPFVRGVPDWMEHYIGFALAQFSMRELGHVQAFLEVPIVNAAVTKLQEDVASVPRRVYQGRGDQRRPIERTGRAVDVGGNLADLLAYANPLDTGRQLMIETIGSLLLTGNGYWKLLRFGNGPLPVELWSLKGQLMRVVPGPGRTIAGYEFDRGTWEVMRPEEIVHFRCYNPEDKPFGLSRLQAVTQSYQAQFYALQWLKQFFFKGGTLAGVWALDEAATVKLTDEEIKATIAKLVSLHLGYEKAWNPVIIQGLKFVVQGMKLSEMELDKQLDIINANIIRALLIPPWQLGIKEGGALGQASAQTDQANYWLETVAGWCSLIDDVLNERLCPLFGRDITVESDFSSVLAVQKARLLQAETHQRLTGGKPVESQNEARAAMRLPLRPEPEADSLEPIAAFSPFGAPPREEGDQDGDEDMRARRMRGTPRPRHLTAAHDRDPLRDQARFGLGRFEKRFERLVLERLAEQRATVHRRLEEQARELGLSGNGRAARLAIDTRALMDEADDADLTRAQRLLEQLLRARGIDAMRELERAADVALEVALDWSGARAAEFLRTQVDRAIRVPDETTRRLLRESLAEGLEAGEALAALVARVDQVFEGRRNNALTIARSETLPAYNFASMEAWRQSGIVEEHEWLTSRSGLGGRHSEDPEGRYAASDGGRGLDGQIRALGEAFDVGGVPLLYPGDPAGPIGELANCVCTTAPVIAEARLRAHRWKILLGRNGDRPPAGPNRLRDYLHAGARA